jgi:hypothetical protein
MIDRRKFLYGAASLFAGPAIIRSGVLMPVKRLIAAPRHNLVAGSSLLVEDPDYYWDWEMHPEASFNNVVDMLDWLNRD